MKRYTRKQKRMSRYLKREKRERLMLYAVLKGPLGAGWLFRGKAGGRYGAYWVYAVVGVVMAVVMPLAVVKRWREKRS